MSENYDVIIIGAGIGGLVCGCYLAKAGMKVLILEKNKNVGGFCSSFEESGYKFNYCIYSLGNYGENGVLTKIFKEDLQIERHVNIKRVNPSNTIFTDDLRLDIYADKNSTIESLKNLFPEEACNLHNFFKYVFETNSMRLYLDLRNKLSCELLDSFFKDVKLKEVLKIPLSSIGSDIFNIPAFSFAIFYRDMLFDSGYYALGGAQALADGLRKVFSEYGGYILTSELAVKVVIKNKKIIGVKTERNNTFFTKFLVSDIDAKQLYFKLIDRKRIEHKFLQKIKNMAYCYSAFIIYLGIKKINRASIKNAYSIWYSRNLMHNYSPIYFKKNKTIFDNPNFLLFFPSLLDKNAAPRNKESACIITLAPYESKLFWNENKNKLFLRIINELEKFIPGLSSSIEYKRIATPIDLENYTLNHKGAIKGWASTLTNNSSKQITQGKIFRNLFNVGHWSTLESGQGGITMVAASGSKASKLIIKHWKK